MDFFWFFIVCRVSLIGLSIKTKTAYAITNIKMPAAIWVYIIFSNPHFRVYFVTYFSKTLKLIYIFFIHKNQFNTNCTNQSACWRTCIFTNLRSGASFVFQMNEPPTLRPTKKYFWKKYTYDYNNTNEHAVQVKSKWQ